jgi:hypothetical protein
MAPGRARARGGGAADAAPQRDALTPYEQERLERISKNREVLQGLGLDQPLPVLLAKPAPKPRAPRPGGGAGGAAAGPEELVATRQSKRQRGQAPEIQMPRPPLDPAREEAREALEAVRAKARAGDAPSGGDEDAEALLAHNLHRCGPMRGVWSAGGGAACGCMRAHASHACTCGALGQPACSGGARPHLAWCCVAPCGPRLTLTDHAANPTLPRIITMSEKALMTRARRITNVAKLVSFIEVGAAGPGRVLAEGAPPKLRRVTLEGPQPAAAAGRGTTSLAPPCCVPLQLLDQIGMEAVAAEARLCLKDLTGAGDE